MRGGAAQVRGGAQVRSTGITLAPLMSRLPVAREPGRNQHHHPDAAGRPLTMGRLAIRFSVPSLRRLIIMSKCQGLSSKDVSARIQVVQRFDY